MFDVQGKWALVTGATRGIGYHIARTMALHGCHLVLHGRKLENTRKIEDDVKQLGVEAYCVEAELSDMNAVDRMLDKIEQMGRPIDIVFNNAGIQVGYRTEFFRTPVLDFTQSFMVNTIAPMRICYRLMPGMIERGYGRLVNTTSGIQGEPQQAAYSASKAALDKVTRDLGTVVEGTDVMINLADPGWCQTDLGGQQAPNTAESSIPGMIVGAFLDDKKSGRWISAQDFRDMTIEDAVKKAESSREK